MDGNRRWKLSDEVVRLSERLAGTCDLTLSDVQAERAARGVVVGYSSVWRRVHRLGLHFKRSDVFQ
jgi:transposase